MRANSRRSHHQQGLFRLQPGIEAKVLPEHLRLLPWSFPRLRTKEPGPPLGRPVLLLRGRQRRPGAQANGHVCGQPEDLHQDVLFPLDVGNSEGS